DGIASIEQTGTGIDDVHASERVAQTHVVDIADEPALHIDDQASAITHRARAEEWQNEIRTGTNAPGTERDAEIGALTWHADRGGCIEAAKSSPRGVHHDSAEAVDAVRHPALQEQVNR